MELSSLQVCMSSPDWLQGTIHEETGIDSSSPSGDILTCTRQPNLMEQSRRLRPPHDQPLKCPRCDSTHTKFCYYNNYSLSQPRYFCKTCRRYWTKGGTLRNVPVGGGCKKNKKVSSSKKSSNHNDHNVNVLGSSSGSGSSLNNDNRSVVSADLQLSFPEVQFSHIANLLGNHFGGFSNNNPNIPMLENPSQIEFMLGNNNNKYDASLVGNSNGDHLGMINEMTNYNPSPNFHNFCAPYALSSSLDHGNNINNHGAIMDINCQRLMLPYDHQYSHEDLDQNSALDVKPNTKLLSMEWHDQGNYFNGVGSSSSSWQGLMNGYGSSSTSHLV